MGEQNYGLEHHKNDPCHADGVEWYFGSQSGFMREPSNAFSALAYLWVFFYILLLGFKDAGSDERSPKATNMPAGVSYIFAVTNLVHFLGCFTNHSSRMFQCHIADVFGMQLIVWTLFIYSVVRQYSLKLPSKLTLLLLVTVSPTILMASLSRYDDCGCEAKEVTLMITLFLAIAYVNKTELKKLLMPVVALLIGVGFQLTDKAENEWINPNWWIHGHAIWHIATAVAMLLMYLFLREPSSSEDDLEDEENQAVPAIVEDVADH